MLLSQRSRLVLGVAPDRVEWIRWGGVVRPFVMASGVKLRDEAAEMAAHDWMLSSVREILDEMGVASLDVSVVLSSKVVKYYLLPDNPALKRQSEWLSLARLHFERVYGMGVSEWQIAISRGRGGEYVASAVEVSLVAALRNLFGDGRRLISIQPILMACVNQNRGKLTKGKHWMVIAEDGMYTYALIEDGRWRHIQSRRASDCLQLLQWIVRDAYQVSAGAGVREVILFGGDCPQMEGCAFNIQSVPCGVEVEAGQFEIAGYGGR